MYGNTKHTHPNRNTHKKKPYKMIIVEWNEREKKPSKRVTSVRAVRSCLIIQHRTRVLFVQLKESEEKRRSDKKCIKTESE